MKQQFEGRAVAQSSSRSIRRKRPAFRFIDLFAGIGGLRRGFEQIGGHCVFTSEWNTQSQKTYAANFRADDQHLLAGDITQVDAADIPQHDVLLAGFPCQPFSIAGVSKKNSLGRAHGFRDEAQGTLFFDVARIIEHHKPAAFLLENVKNLARHDKGRTFQVIVRTLQEELGYHNLHWRILNARCWVPQNRERIFLAGFRNSNGFSFDNLPVPDLASGPRLRSILHPEDGSEPPDEPYTQGPRGTVNPRYTLSDKLWQYLQNYADKHRGKGNGFGFGLVGPDDVARTLSARYHKDGSEILIAQHGRNPRRLTPRECARLMGFERPGEASFVIPVADTSAYQQFGNAVVVDVVAAIAEHLRPWLPDRSAPPQQLHLPLQLSTDD
ncbi:cytosine-specific methyltransferase [Planctomycetia bacterium]|nr:cytosine-specific methyltransferase [Planctomycetia bacterium]